MSSLRLDSASASASWCSRFAFTVCSCFSAVRTMVARCTLSSASAAGSSSTLRGGLRSSALQSISRFTYTPILDGHPFVECTLRTWAFWRSPKQKGHACFGSTFGGGLRRPGVLAGERAGERAGDRRAEWRIDESDEVDMPFGDRCGERKLGEASPSCVEDARRTHTHTYACQLSPHAIVVLRGVPGHHCHRHLH